MKHRPLRWLTRGLGIAALSATVVSAIPAHAAPWDGKQFNFVDPRFQQVWSQTDANPNGRSLVWGPRPWFDYREFYKQSPNGLRQVQYFDKSRMEINNPAVTTGPLGGVTNGLLPVEMVSGRVKLGDAETSDQFDQRAPAAIPVAGDLAKVNPDAPTYASFTNLATTDGGSHTADQHLGTKVGTTLDKNGNIGLREDLANQPGTTITAYTAITGHNVPQIFADYEKSSVAPVDPLAAFGYPITEAYWITAKVGGVSKDIMVQIFQRRVLTYTPSNNDPFKVEMGNVGQHYFQWRYPVLGTPWDAPAVYTPIAFGSFRNTSGHLEVFTTDANGGSQSAITAGGAETEPFSMLRSWDASQFAIIGDSRRDTGHQQLYRLSLNGSSQTRLLSSSANDFNGAVSPDGTKVAFASDRTGRVELFLMNIGGTGLVQLTSNTTTCTTQHASWLPNGSGLIYTSNCGGTYQIYRADFSYTQDQANSLVATLINVKRLTNNAANDTAPRLSPDGSRIAFVSDRDGNAEIYIMNSDGTLQRRLTTSAGSDGAPTWSPDNSKLVFESNRDGDYELYIITTDGNGQTQLTNNTVDDRYPIWAQ
ncbi:MAG: PD40 domain-containing protein [Herpetosiphonaceae bacterium]|nr:PD40 domain-containing protein [Herpetosiphonaceae bacterium]